MTTEPIEIQNEISGGYCASLGGFCSGPWNEVPKESYGRVLNHSIRVLECITLTTPRSDCWGHQGISVNRWMHHGIELISSSITFTDSESFRSFLKEHDIEITTTLSL